MKIRNANDLSHHILPNSATMVGVCIMVISIVKGLAPAFPNMLLDKFLAINSILFMLSALLSFYSIRSIKESSALERWAEIIFLFGLGLLTIITVIFALEIT